MNDSERRALVEQTQQRIAAVLADLERQTGCYVDGLEVVSLEITTERSTAPEFLRRVEIDLRRAPGSRWQS
jgi:hypothetical protein